MRLRNRTIFILGTAKFDDPVESTSFTIAKYLAKDNRVFYIDYPFTWRDCFRKAYRGRYLRRRPFFRPFSPGLLDVGIPGLRVAISLPVASINFLPEGPLYRFLLRFNEGVVVRRVNRILRRHGIGEYVFLNSFNFNFPRVADRLTPRPSLRVYQCVDPLVIAYDVRHGRTSEPLLVKGSDLVICTSRGLYEEKRLLNPHTFFIPNAADLQHSGKALDPDLPVHPGVAGLPRPVIGYFGHIERRFDYGLLEGVIRSNPDKSFVFAGPVSPDWPPPPWFYRLPNIHRLGRIPYEQMPNVLKGFDVALIPFKRDAVSRTIFPLKLFEYLGAGRPVVASAFNPDLAEFTGRTVRFAGDPEGFSRAIGEALEDRDPTQRLAIALENTWERRVAEISELMGQYLAGAGKH